MLRNSILVADNDMGMAELLKRRLSVAGYSVTVSIDAVKARELIERERFDLAILDAMMTDRSEVAERAKARLVPIIYLTARVDSLTRQRTVKLDCVDKPVDITELLDRVQNVLKQGKTGVISIADIEINLSERKVLKAGSEVRLKPMEFDVLLMLAKNRNSALSREKLMHMVWCTDFVGQTRTVDVHIAQLRKKLGFKNIIKTVSKVGYMIEE